MPGHENFVVQPATSAVGGRSDGIQQGPRVFGASIHQEPNPHIGGLSPRHHSTSSVSRYVISNLNYVISNLSYVISNLNYVIEFKLEPISSRF